MILIINVLYYINLNPKFLFSSILTLYLNSYKFNCLISFLLQVDINYLMHLMNLYNNYTLWIDNFLKREKKKLCLLKFINFENVIH